MDAREALNSHLLASGQAARDIVEALGRLRAALTRADSRSEQLAALGDFDPDRRARLANAMESTERISEDLTRLGKYLAPLTREARGPMVAKSR